MKGRNFDTESLLREAMQSTATPDAELVRRLKNNLTMEEPILSKFRITRSVSTVAVVAVVLIFTAASAVAAWHFIKPGAVAEKIDDYALSATFDSETAVNINETVTSGDYVFTFLAIASGKDISDRPYYSNDDLQNDRTYAVLAIQKADSTPFDRQNPDESFFVSPLIKGTNPAMVNTMSMDGGYTDVVADGVLYRIIECDNVEMFADRELYLVVCSGSPMYNGNAFILNEQTNEITANPNFDGASAVFDLPIDKKLADPLKAEQYLKDLFPEPSADNDITDSQNDADVGVTPKLAIENTSGYDANGESLTPQEQITVYLTDMMTAAYFPFYEGLRFEMSNYAEILDSESITATFYWTMYHLNNGLDVSYEIGLEEQGNFSLQVVARLDESGHIVPGTIKILSDTAANGPAEYTQPIEDFFNDLPEPSQTQITAKNNSAAAAAARAYYAGNGLGEIAKLELAEVTGDIEGKMKDETIAFNIELVGDPEKHLGRFIVLTRDIGGSWEIVSVK